MPAFFSAGNGVVMFEKIKNIFTVVTMMDGLAILEETLPNDLKTYQWYLSSVMRFTDFHGNMSLKKVTPKHIQTWSKHIETGENKRTGGIISPVTVNLYRRGIRAFFNHMEKLELIEKSPTKNFSVPDAPKQEAKYLEDDEVQLLLHHSSFSPPHKALVYALYESGARIGEVLSMTVSQLHFEKNDSTIPQNQRKIVEVARRVGCLHLIRREYHHSYIGRCLINAKKTSAMKKQEYIYFSNDSCLALLDYLDWRPANSPDELWVNERGKSISKQTLYGWFKAVAKRAGIEATPHQMRHSLAYSMRNEGYDWKDIQETLRHSKLSTTADIYGGSKEADKWKRHQEFFEKKAKMPAFS